MIKKSENKDLPEFHEIIDIIAETEKGNFSGFIVALKNNYIDINYVSLSGYNILHQSICYNDKFITCLLIDYFKIDVNIISKTKQTPIMIASNFGFLELMKLLIEKGADINMADECNFNSLFYATKQNQILCVFYLFYKGANFNIVDNNGCNLVHWAAYKNNLYLLMIFKTMDFDINLKDFHNVSPLQRAINGDSYECMKFLIENCFDECLKEINIDEIQNIEIKNYIIEQKNIRFSNKFYIKSFIFKLWNNNSKFLISLFYLMNLFCSFIYFMEIEKNESSNLRIIFFVIAIYFILYLFWFIFKMKNDINDNNQKLKNSDYCKENDQKDDVWLKILSTINENDIKNYNFLYLNSLIPKKMKLIDEIEHKHNFLEIIAYLIEKNDFLNVIDIDINRFCPTCLEYKESKTKHCSICKICVKYYHHHSAIFKRCFNYSNHLYYIILLFFQEILLFLLMCLALNYYQKLNSSIFFTFFEIGFVISQENGFFYCVYYFFNLVILAYNTGFFGFELYCISKNITSNEFLNRQKYKYLYSKQKYKNEKSYYVYEDIMSKGIKTNINHYLKRFLI